MISKGQVSTEGVRKLFIGVGSSYIKAVNPTGAELEALYGKPQDKEPKYVETVEVDGKSIPQVRLTFIVQPNPSKYLDSKNRPIDILVPVTLFLKKQYRYSKNTNKYQIMDNYGRTAWATEEEIKNKTIPMVNVQGTMQPANISPDYKPAYDGEEELTDLIRSYLNIPKVEKWDNGKIVGMIDNPTEAEVRLDDMDALFKGDFTELKTAFGYQPNNMVKIAFGIKTKDGKQFMAPFTRKFLKNNITDYSKLSRKIADTKQAGALANTEFECVELHEYQITPTNFTNTPSTDFAPSEEGFDLQQTPWSNQ